MTYREILNLLKKLEKTQEHQLDVEAVFLGRDEERHQPIAVLEQNDGSLTFMKRFQYFFSEV